MKKHSIINFNFLRIFRFFFSYFFCLALIVYLASALEGKSYAKLFILFGGFRGKAKQHHILARTTAIIYELNVLRDYIQYSVSKCFINLFKLRRERGNGGLHQQFLCKTSIVKNLSKRVFNIRLNGSQSFLLEREGTPYYFA